MMMKKQNPRRFLAMLLCAVMVFSMLPASALAEETEAHTEHAEGRTNAAGIGGGNHSSGYGNITIYGGNVTAQGGSSGAGIGKGQQNSDSDCGVISIYGGVVNATGGKYSAGIGGGEDRGGGIIRIYGGEVTAQGGHDGAGIGGGEGGTGGDISISGGTVNATGGDQGAGIGGGEDGTGGSITISAGNVIAEAGFKGAAIGGGERGAGGTVTIHGGAVYAYGAYTRVKYDKNDYQLNPSDSEGLEGGAGIGGGNKGNAGTILIDGGYVEANTWLSDCYGLGAAIGTGYAGENGSITIAGGTVSALASFGAAIGGSCKTTFKGTITISGGMVDADSTEGVGIGGTNFEGTITITGGTVNVKSTYESAIGAVNNCKGTISITGGVVKTKAKVKAIGHGQAGSKDGTLNLGNDMKVIADSTLQNASSRVSACRSYRYVEISPCDHSGEWTYTLQAQADVGHIWHCKYCKTTGEEAHTFSGSPQTCEKCGYEYIPPEEPPVVDSRTCTVTLMAYSDTTGAETDLWTEIVIPYHADFVLPECEFEPKTEGDRFEGWRMFYENEDPELSGYYGEEVLKPGTTIPNVMQEEAFFIAKWVTTYPIGFNWDMTRDNRLETVPEGRAAAGETVQMKLSADNPEGWKLASIDVYKKDGSQQKVAVAEDLSSFVMPDCEVEIEPTFIPVHQYSAKEWTWTETDGTWTATVTLVCDHHEGENPVTVQAQTLERIEGTSYYRATATYEGVTYTDDHQKMTWNTLQAMILDGASDIVLENDVTATSDDTALTIPSSADVTIDMNGYTINRDLASPVYTGSAVIVYGSLEITDSKGGGTITGGNTTGQGGGIYLDPKASLVMNGGTITGNNASGTGNNGKGGGVYVGTASFTMNGGSITGNTSQMEGGGVYLLINGTFAVSGSVSITSNNKGEATNNVSMGRGGIINVSNLSEGTSIGVVVAKKEAVFTNGANSAYLQYFSSDHPGYDVVVDDDTGELILQKKEEFTVTFDSDGGSTVKAQTVVTGQTATEPETPPTKDGFTFKGWYQVTDADQGTLADAAFDFENTAITADITLKAVWEEVQEPVFVGHQVELTGEIGLIFKLKLPEGKTAEDYPESYITIEGDKLNRNPAQYTLSDLSRDSDGVRYVFTVYLSSIQMAEPITPTFHYTENEEEKTVVGDPYSLKDYLDWAMNEGGFTGKNLSIVKSLADYGHYAQIYLSQQNGWTIGKDYAEMTTFVTGSYDYDTVKSAAEPKALTWTEGSSTVQKVNQQVTFGATIKLTAYITPVSGQTIDTVTVDGNMVTPTKSSSRYMVTIDNIFANQLADSHTIIAGDCTITISPMSYVYAVLNSSTTSNEWKNIVCALYNYAQACN